jgi:hypothetical protein
MPKCQVCYKLLPPNFMVKIEGTNVKKCIFCEKGKNEIEYKEGLSVKKYTKEEAIKEYNELLNKLKDSKGIAKILAKGVKGE